MKYIHDIYGYKALFDDKTGLLLRYEPKNEHLFWKQSGPELLDVSITNYCEKGCDFCYRRSNPSGKSISIDLYKKILQEAKQSCVTQIALGGGNPNQHPYFINILKMTREQGIIPTYTTNGQGMTDEIYVASSKYAGAVAVSWYEPYQDALNVIDKCNHYNITVNLHYVLNAKNISNAQKLLQSSYTNKVNSIIFLNYKPVGSSKRQILQYNQELKNFLENAINNKSCKIGFDSCMISHLAQHKDLININSVDFCEAARFSAFISETGLVYPCSFMCGAGASGHSIKNKSLIDIWQNSFDFIKIRKKILYGDNKCSSCNFFDFCHSGCPYFEINCKFVT